MIFAPIPEETERIAQEIVDAGFRVHSALGPGLLESAYQHCLGYELTSRGLSAQAQVPMPIRYGEIELDAGYRLDLLVDKVVIVELKAVDALLPFPYPGKAGDS